MIQLLLFFLIGSVSAQSIDVDPIVLSPFQIAQVIGDYPKPGSKTYQDDFNTLLQYQQLRSARDCQLAQKDTGTSLRDIFGGLGGILSEAEVSRLSNFLLQALASAGTNAYMAKMTYRRPRPYVTNRNLRPCISLDETPAYPSGHSMLARLYARILSRIYPERTEFFLRRAQQYSLNRVIGGVHHPSDVAAAHKLADYLARVMLQDNHFSDKMRTQY